MLHHAGPIAGAALLAGTAGTLLFGAIGLIASVPAGLLTLFAAGFAVSAFLIGPAIAGDDKSGSAEPSTVEPSGHSEHHE